MGIVDPLNGRPVPLDIDLQKRWAKDHAEWSRQECRHENQELRRGTNKGGAPVVRMQCLDCGLRVGNPVKRPHNAEELPEFDDAMHDDYNVARMMKKEEIDKKYLEFQLRRWKGREQADSYYQQAHNAYLASPEWQNLRQRVIDRSQGLCEGCRLRPPTEVHHLSYEHWGHEFLFELVALCGDCHDRIHAKGDHEAIIKGCRGCLHANRDYYCLRYDTAMVAALEADELCSFDRVGFEPAT